MSYANPIHLAIAFDLNYLQHFYALFSSIIENNKRNKFHVHAIITGVSKAEQEVIEQYAQANASTISFYEIDEAFVKKFVLTGSWTPAVYYRLFFPLMLPADVTRVLYLDTDIIVVDDLLQLYNVELAYYPVAAVYDNWVQTAPQLGITKEGDYFNSGMMLINVPIWKEQGISEKVFDYLYKYPENIKFVDQCGLNAVLINNWMKLEPRFNVIRSRIPEGMSSEERARFLEDKVIIHYTLDRPWKMLCQNPYRYLYFYYLKRSPFKLIKKFDDYSINKVPQYIRIRIIELYHDFPLVKQIWQGVKSSLKR